MSVKQIPGISQRQTKEIAHEKTWTTFNGKTEDKKNLYEKQ